MLLETTLPEKSRKLVLVEEAVSAVPPVLELLGNLGLGSVDFV